MKLSADLLWEVTTVVEEYEMRLAEMSVPEGEILGTDLAAIVSRLQDLSTRVSRWVAGVDGAGRAQRSVETAGALRISGLRSGSTVFDIRTGSHDALDFELPHEVATAEKFWEMMAAIGNDAPPVGAPESVRASAMALLEALDRAAPLVEIQRRPDHARVEFRPRDRDRSVWKVAPPNLETGEVTVVGTLEMVDLRSGKFRVRDDVGHKVKIDRIDTPNAVATFIGQRTAVTGTATHDENGVVETITYPDFELVEAPNDWQVDTSPWGPPALAPGPDPEGGVDFDDEEWDSFMTAVRGA